MRPLRLDRKCEIASPSTSSGFAMTDMGSRQARRVNAICEIAFSLEKLGIRNDRKVDEF